MSILNPKILNIRNYSAGVINIQRPKADLNIVSLRLSIFNIQQIKREIFVLLYTLFI